MEKGGAAEMGPMLLRKMQATSYMLPDGHYWKFIHENGCRENEREEGWNHFIEAANPRTVNELVILIRGLKKRTGCGRECGVVKDDTVDVLFPNTQSTSSYRPRDLMQTNTGSSLVLMMSPSSSAPSWLVSDISANMTPSEKKLYRNFKMDQSSDDIYMPRSSAKKAINVEVPMTLEGGCTTKRDSVMTLR